MKGLPCAGHSSHIPFLGTHRLFFNLVPRVGWGNNHSHRGREDRGGGAGGGGGGGGDEQYQQSHHLGSTNQCYKGLLHCGLGGLRGPRYTSLNAFSTALCMRLIDRRPNSDVCHDTSTQWCFTMSSVIIFSVMTLNLMWFELGGVCVQLLYRKRTQSQYKPLSWKASDNAVLFFSTLRSRDWCRENTQIFFQTSCLKILLPWRSWHCTAPDVKLFAKSPIDFLFNTLASLETNDLPLSWSDPRLDPPSLFLLFFGSFDALVPILATLRKGRLLNFG